MRKVIGAIVILAGLGLGCATLHWHNPDGSVNVPKVLSDMRWSVMEACAVEWLPPAACTFAFDALDLADAKAAENKPGMLAAVRQIIVDAEAKLPPDHKLRPYLDLIIKVLS